MQCEIVLSAKLGERSNFLMLSGADFEALKAVYKHKAANEFIGKFEAAVYDLESNSYTSTIK